MDCRENKPCDRSRFLIVDDEAAILQVFCVVLAHGFPDRKIDVAVNGLEALEAFNTSHQSVVLMDLRMPVMPGDTAFRAIEKACRERRWELPSVIFCTGYAPPDTVMSLVAGHPEHSVLLKPVTNDALVAEFKRKLEHG